jgi:hypothetical protein
MTTLKLLVVAVGLAAFGAQAQTGDRASTPPGVSQDGAKPSDGAIKGGSILPGEQSGLPDERRMRQRCEELSGTLRDDCLKQQRDAGIGGTVKPLEERVTEPRTKSPEPEDSAAGSSSTRR